MDRRKMLSTTAGITGGALLSKSLFGSSLKQNPDKIKAIVVGAHPDDPESGCGGTICKLTSAGHDVVVLYLTKGEAGLSGKTHLQAAEIRSGEAQEACRIMGARPVFYGQIDGNTKIDKEEYKKMAKVIEEENPDIVFTHWPIDTHPDHRVASNLVYNAWNWFRYDKEKAFDLYYFEVLTGAQTQNFQPTHYIDVTETAGLKREATLKHVCQNPKEWFVTHEKMGAFRGMELHWNAKCAEAFVRQGMSSIKMSINDLFVTP